MVQFVIVFLGKYLDGFVRHKRRADAVGAEAPLVPVAAFHEFVLLGYFNNFRVAHGFEKISFLIRQRAVAAGPRRVIVEFFHHRDGYVVQLPPFPDALLQCFPGNEPLVRLVELQPVRARAFPGLKYLLADGAFRDGFASLELLAGQLDFCPHVLVDHLRLLCRIIPAMAHFITQYSMGKACIMLRSYIFTNYFNIIKLLFIVPYTVVENHSGHIFCDIVCQCDIWHVFVFMAQVPNVSI
ncbi:hypothetical protein KL86DPRO_10962 [uncultured delta proteobacterium]|uniref:Uncharacterized protein n=1 Tax=uncultured delta proteobacterium TaxID=34034 RepID=A0A212J947_9DELT|nr:hypothetical protein KL86DPRO_10962 [uncultured delta proteobacterium]